VSVAEDERRWGPWQRLALLVWAVVAIAAVGRGLLYGSRHHTGVYPVYERAGAAWTAGHDLYSQRFNAEAFAYSPPVAALLAPFAALPGTLGPILWRTLLVGVYLAGLLRWGRLLALEGRRLAWLALLVVPMTAPTLLNGQAGALVAGLLLLSVADAAGRRWNRAALWSVLAAFVKVYPLAVALLLAVAFPHRLTRRLFVAVLLVFAASFLMQRPAYVAAQYADWLRLLAVADVSPWYRGQFNCDVQLLLSNCCRPIPSGSYRILQLLLAGGIALLTWILRPVLGRRELPATVFALAACWMTVVGPAVESFTYILLGPPLAWLLLDAAREPRFIRPHAVGLLLAWSLLATASAAVWFPFGAAVRRLGVHPVAGLLVTACLLSRLYSRLRTAPALAPC
jgi:hypothetical protein